MPARSFFFRCLLIFFCLSFILDVLSFLFSMRLFSISVDGCSPPSLRLVEFADNSKAWAICHGEEGRNRWEYRIIFPPSLFPPHPDRRPDPEAPYSMKELNRKDSFGNPLFSLRLDPFAVDPHHLIFLNPCMGFRGGASFSVRGHIRQIAAGKFAQGDAGRMGDCLAPVFMSYGCPSQIIWVRHGRLYGSPANWIARRQLSGEWLVLPFDEFNLLYPSEDDADYWNE